MDKYDEAIEYFESIEDPDELACAIDDAWAEPEGTEGGCLFMPAGKLRPGEAVCHSMKRGLGCLTLVRGGADAAANIGFEETTLTAETPELTAAIIADERIPSDPQDIGLHNLHVFAEWQRRLDRELGRE